MARKRRSARRRSSRRRLRNKQRAVRIVEYEITSDSIPDKHFESLPGHVKDSVDRLHDEAQHRPRKVIPELVELVEKYPMVPMFYNFLSAAYSNAGQAEKAEEAIRENYERNPDYLFARLNYAELCRSHGNYEEIPEIFEHKFDLKLLYPERKQFHISEVANFMGIIGLYFLEAKNNKEVAQKYYDILKEIAPDYPATKILETKLEASLFTQMLKRIVDQGQSESS